MDTYKRRQTWDLLLHERKDKTILLSTHDMEEAEVLGDHIAIMAEGRLRCLGSSLYLKENFGHGYDLTIMRSPNATVPASEITSVVVGTVPDACLKGAAGAELRYILPKTHTNRFADLLRTLTEQQVRLQIGDYGISVTSMEEIFLNVAEGARSNQHASLGDELNPRESNDDQRSHKKNCIDENTGALASESVVGNEDNTATSSNLNSTGSPASPGPVAAGNLQLYLWQARALLNKRWLQWKRTPKMIIVFFLVPVILMIVGLSVVTSTPTTGNEPNLLFGLAGQYQPNTIYFSQRDIGGDYYSGAYNSTTYLLSEEATVSPNYLLGQLPSHFYSLLNPSDPRFSMTTPQDITGANVTSYIIDAAVNYYSTAFYRRHVVAISAEPGAFRFSNVNNLCALRVNNTFSTSVTLTLTPNRAYDFVLIKNLPSDGLVLSSSSVPSSSTIIPYYSISTYNVSRVDVGRFSTLHWMVSSADIGKTYYLLCNANHSSGISLTVASASSTNHPSESTGERMLEIFCLENEQGRLKVIRCVNA